MCPGVNNGILEKLDLNQLRRIKVRITDVANTHFYVDDPGDYMENGSNGSTTLKETAIFRVNKDRVKIDPVFIRTIIVEGLVITITNLNNRKQNDDQRTRIHKTNTGAIYEL